jgi:hypothetical protein
MLGNSFNQLRSGNTALRPRLLGEFTTRGFDFDRVLRRPVRQAFQLRTQRYSAFRQTVRTLRSHLFRFMALDKAIAFHLTKDAGQDFARNAETPMEVGEMGWSKAEILKNRNGPAVPEELEHKVNTFMLFFSRRVRRV